ADADNLLNIIWYRVIVDFKAKSPRTEEEKILNPKIPRPIPITTETKKSTKWFELDITKIYPGYIDGFLGYSSKLSEQDKEELRNNKGRNFHAKRSIHEKITTTQFSENRTYTVKLDEDKDGFVDSEMVYHYTSNTIETHAEITKDTYIATENLVKILEENDIKDIDLFLATPDEEIRRELKYFQKYTEFTSINTSNQYVYEDIQFHDYEYGENEYGELGNELVEIRQYKDNFIDKHSIYDISDKVRIGSEADEQGELTYTGNSTLTINNTDYNTELSIRSEGVTLFTVMNVSQINWDVPTWGPDNVPIRFDTLTTGRNIVKEYSGAVDENGDVNDLPFRYENGSSTTESLFDKTITISIANRYSLYHDYLRSTDSIYDLTEFIVKGIFITPKEGVYYSSQKKDYDVARPQFESGFDYGANRQKIIRLTMEQKHKDITCYMIVTRMDFTKLYLY
ncbi:hypothetical protein LCGC14_2332200, partial [marine sediment metagenome]